MVKISLQLSAAYLRDMGLNIKHGLIDEQEHCRIAGMQVLGPVSYLDFVCDRF